ncbi:MAG: 4-hydroxybutyrate CoA-transferase, partial [Myxococcaceae bacterium]|nr:4-hydroxybutyrate CoA-transferase [Myxococcaceae bacterium]
MTADDAVRLIHSHSRVFVQGAAATPTLLLEALARRGHELEGVETVHLHLDGDAPHARPELS